MALLPSRCPLLAARLRRPHPLQWRSKRSRSHTVTTDSAGHTISRGHHPVPPALEHSVRLITLHVVQTPVAVQLPDHVWSLSKAKRLESSQTPSTAALRWTRQAGTIEQSPTQRRPVGPDSHFASQRCLPWTCLMKLATWVALLLFLSIGPVRADLLQLKTGAKLRGTWENPSEPPPEFYEFTTQQGARLRLARKQVASVKRESPALMHYQQWSPRSEDSVAAHWKLAQWCRANGLIQQRSWHLERILALDPNHVAARRGLGYGQLNGQWVLPDDLQRQRGFVQHEGRWKLPQQVQLLEEREAIQRAARLWRAKIERLSEDLRTEKAKDAYQQLVAIRDPLAISGFVSLLQTTQDRRVRLIYVNILEQIEDPRARQVLLAFALQDADSEVAMACLESIVRKDGPDLTPELVKLLRHPDNRLVNRAAWVLGEVGSQTAIGPLIEALHTSHQQVLSPNPGRLATGSTYSFARGPNSADAPLSMTNSPSPTSQTVLLPNPAVLNALTKLTKGVSFSFDQRAWQRWFSQRNLQQP